MIFRQYEQVIKGTKTQTRRVLKEDDEPFYFETISGVPNSLGGASVEPTDGVSAIVDHARRRTRYAVGKTYPVIPKMYQPAILYCPDIDIIAAGDEHYEYAKAGTWNWQGQGYLKARIRITALRVERLHTITEADAMTEGVASVSEYRELWESINGKSKLYRWDANPEVVVLTFEMVQA